MLSICLDKKCTFRPGSMITGHMVFQSNKKQKVEGIYLRFKGVEYTSWEQKKDELATNVSKKKWYIFKQVETLYGSPWDIANKDLHRVTIKEYRWAFSFVLPEDIPPSLRANHGKTKIEYVLKGHVKIPKRNSIKCRELLEVGALFKESPTLPIFTKDETMPFVSSKKRISLTAILSRSVSWIHDDYSFDLNLINNLPQTLKNAKIELVKYLKSGSKTQKKVVGLYVLADGFPLLRGSTYNQTVTIKLPSDLLPTCMGTMIQITYHLRVKVKLSRFKTASISAPLLITSFNPRVF